MRKNILDSTVAREFISKYNLKKVVSGRGHDCGGLIADFYIKSRLIATYHDDGWGGDAEIHFTSDKIKEELMLALKGVKFDKLLFDNGWEFMKTPDRIDLETQVESIITSLVMLKEEVKLQRQCLKGFIFGTTFYRSTVSWSGKSLKDLPTPLLQMTYDKYKKELKKGQKFYNTDEQLIELGIKI
jgi:hypothetical protein